MKRRNDFDDFDDYEDENWDRKRNLVLAFSLVVVIAVIGMIVKMLFFPKEKEVEIINESNAVSIEESISETEQLTSTPSIEEKIDEEDPQIQETKEETQEPVDVSQVLGSGNQYEVSGLTLGIDVARWQGTIDWKQVAASGVEFAMVRVGYRTLDTGEIKEDPQAKYNMQEAQAAGIKLGAYFFSTAVSKEEAVQEADWTADFVAKYQITYPIAYNCEGFNNSGNRQYSLDNATRSDIAIAFLDEINNRGYTPMFYAAKNELTGNAKWDTDRLQTRYKVWVSQYPTVPYPETTVSDYTGPHAMWQYTSQGMIAGINKAVDVNVAYFNYTQTADAKDTEAPEAVSTNVEALINFTEVNETVTAKDKTNLRNAPSTSTGSVVATIANGEQITRTGTSSSGWSRVSYNGQNLYAVSNFLTTDLTAAPVKTPEAAPAEAAPAEAAPADDGIKTKFTAVNETVSPKISVNLRSLPSVTNEQAYVIAKLEYGQTVTRTGISDNGWSRVDYNGQTLYCVSSYVYVWEAPQQ